MVKKIFSILRNTLYLPSRINKEKSDYGIFGQIEAAENISQLVCDTCAQHVKSTLIFSGTYSERTLSNTLAMHKLFTAEEIERSIEHLRK